jgi:hypothetical protein
MKTELGKYILKQNSKSMGMLNTQARKMAKSLNAVDKQKNGWLAPGFEVLRQFEINREEHDELQKQINLIMFLETFLD